MSLKYTLKWLGTALLAIMLTSCGGTAEDITPSPTVTATTSITSESITPTATPAAIPTATPTPPATPTPTLVPTPTPIPPLAHEFTYIVQSGDTLEWILQLYGVYDPADRDRILNYYVALNELPDPNTLFPGTVLRIPVNVHIVAAGESADLIAALHNITPAELQRLNPELLTDINLLNIGWELRVNPNSEAREPLCDDVLARIPPTESVGPVVFEIVIHSREELLCLRDYFGLSAATLLKLQPEYIYAIQNGDFGTDGLLMTIPSESGAGFLVSSDDTTVNFIADYHDTTPDNVYFWNGEPVGDTPLTTGDRIFTPQINLTGITSFGSAPPVFLSVGVSAENGQSVIVDAAPPASDSIYTILPTGTPPPGAILPSSQPIWRNAEDDAGWCNPQDGFGWTGAPTWPTLGTELNPERGFRISHTALDILGESGEPIYAAESGIVVWAGSSHKSTGNSVVIAHGNTWQTHYYHLLTIDVGCGEVVQRGQQIGTMGTAGRTHLHFEIRWQGFAFNPLDYLP
ncbi:MAG: LysM peptidoglycan-binding domain-containing M23 family metallopeptidase [Anaerolineae bacterium]|nr:LysM peptidoglycan-binding domain-containing M23 family metallopeptidase [Anaerolineae bacterium]